MPMAAAGMKMSSRAHGSRVATGEGVFKSDVSGNTGAGAGNVEEVSAVVQRVGA